MKTVQMVAIEKVRVINSRARSEVKFKELVSNISKVGLKRPITVSPREGSPDNFDLVCGQGRLEACVALGYTEVPAVVVDAPLQDRYLMSLVENLARPPRTTLQLAREIQAQKERGCSIGDIAAKVGLSETYVTDLARLIQKGEERLVEAVERGEVPLGIAMEIANTDDPQIQSSLREAYETGKLKGKALMKVRRLLETRRVRGKTLRGAKGSYKAKGARGGRHHQDLSSRDTAPRGSGQEGPRGRSATAIHRVRDQAAVRGRQPGELAARRGAGRTAEVPRGLDGQAMTTSPKAAFKFAGVMVKLEQLLPCKKAREDLKRTSAYKTIVASIGEVGIIEPPMVYPAGHGKYLLVDGQARVEALKDLKIDEVFCLIATDDETYTYNRQRIHVAPIQANKMVLKAIEIGVSEERIAKTLNLSPTTIHNSRSLLQGICRESIELLKDKHVPKKTLQELKKVKAMRQIVMAELMTATGTYVAPYAQALVAMSNPDELVEDRKPGKTARTKAQDLARIEHEMHALEKDFLLREDTYGRTVLELTLARAYLKKLLENSRVVRHLAQKHRDLLAEFQRIVETTALDKLSAG